MIALYRLTVPYNVLQRPQPADGFLPISKFTVENFGDPAELHITGKLMPLLRNLCVDCLVRFVLGGEDAHMAFRSAILGAELAAKSGYIPDAVEDAKQYCSLIHGIDDESIVAACQLCTFTAWQYGTIIGAGLPRHIDAVPDLALTTDISLLAQRTIDFFRKQGPLILDYENLVQYCHIIVRSVQRQGCKVANTLWRLHCHDSAPTKADTLMFLTWFYNGRQGTKEIFEQFKYMGFYNPVLNCSYTLPVENIPSDAWSEAAHCN